jgi:hypothetical protein
MKSFSVIESERREAPATIVEMAVLNFAGESDLRGKSDKELAEVSRRRADEIYNASYLTLAMMRMDKDDLVSSIRESGEEECWVAMLDMLKGGQEAADCLMKLCQRAEVRLLMAMATVELEGPDDPDGGGEDVPAEESEIAA